MATTFDGRPVRGRRLKIDPELFKQLGQTPAGTDGMFTEGPRLQENATAAGGQYNWSNTGGTAAGQASNPGLFSRLFSQQNMNNFYQKGAQVASTVAPFLSNITNAMRRPPMPKQGQPYQYTPLQRVNLSDERNQISNLYQAAGRSTERNLDSNTAEAVKAFNRGDEIAKLSSVSERENNINANISNQQAQMDAQVSAANTGLVNKYQDELVERQVAQQRESSANWANAGDKIVAIGNERRKARTELAKARVLSTGLYGNSGVMDRSRARMKAEGLPDPLGLDYADLSTTKKAAGGMLIGPAIPTRKVK